MILPPNRLYKRLNQTPAHTRTILAAVLLLTACGSDPDNLPPQRDGGMDSRGNLNDVSLDENTVNEINSTDGHIDRSHTEIDVAIEDGLTMDTNLIESGSNDHPDSIEEGMNDGGKPVEASTDDHTSVDIVFDMSADPDGGILLDGNATLDGDVTDGSIADVTTTHDNPSSDHADSGMDTTNLDSVIMDVSGDTTMIDMDRAEIGDAARSSCIFTRAIIFPAGYTGTADAGTIIFGQTSTSNRVSIAYDPAATNTQICFPLEGPAFSGGISVRSAAAETRIQPALSTVLPTTLVQPSEFSVTNRLLLPTGSPAAICIIDPRRALGDFAIGSSFAAGVAQPITVLPSSGPRVTCEVIFGSLTR